MPRERFLGKCSIAHSRCIEAITWAYDNYDGTSNKTFTYLLQNINNIALGGVGSNKANKASIFTPLVDKQTSKFFKSTKDLRNHQILKTYDPKFINRF